MSLVISLVLVPLLTSSSTGMKAVIIVIGVMVYKEANNPFKRVHVMLQSTTSLNEDGRTA